MFEANDYRIIFYVRIVCKRAERCVYEHIVWIGSRYKYDRIRAIICWTLIFLLLTYVQKLILYFLVKNQRESNKRSTKKS